MDLKRIFTRRRAAPTVARFGEIPAVAAGLPQWLRRHRRTPPARLIVEAQPFLVDAEHASDADLVALASRLAEALAAPDVVRTVPVEARVAAWLAAQQRREALADFVVERTHVAGQFPTRLVGDRILADFGELQPRDIPEDLLEVEPRLAEMELRIRRCRSAPGGVALELLAVVRALDFGTHRPAFTVSRDGEPLAVDQVDDPAASRFTGRRHQCHDAGTLHLTLPDADRDLRVELVVGEFRRTADLGAGRIRARVPHATRTGQVTDVTVVEDVVRLVGTDVEVPLVVDRRFHPRGPRPSGPVALPHLEPSPQLAGRLPLELVTPVTGWRSPHPRETSRSSWPLRSPTTSAVPIARPAFSSSTGRHRSTNGSRSSRRTPARR
ncbi:hypothetical protein [Nocardioides alcanivorans]|uniref:hypothetical protein n=1 Tax=Nocardioides alcanivorans TaxID=2897352 RepID=UPI001F367737|nr:hypothetical protein [Nocardioides alcanivorans]